jgi:hypothetical protein
VNEILARNVTAGQRIVERHGGKYTSGEWCRASGLTAKAAKELEAELMWANYQVRSREAVKGDTWELLFR